MKASEIEWKNGIVTAWDLDDLNLNESIESQFHFLKEDLIQAEFTNAIILDLGWYPEFNSQGQFVLSVVRIQNWENPIFQIKFHKLSELVQNLNHAIKVASGRLS